MVRRYSGELFSLANSLVGNSADAEDVLQQAFIGALRGIERFQGRSSLRTWLYSIVANQASKLRRSKKVRRALSLDPVSTGERASAEPDGVPNTRSPEPAVDGRLDVEVMLEALSPEHREVIVLRELQQLSYDEIAEALGIPRGTVESRLFRARRALKERFSPETV